MRASEIAGVNFGGFAQCIASIAFHYIAMCGFDTKLVLTYSTNAAIAPHHRSTLNLNLFEIENIGTIGTAPQQRLELLEHLKHLEPVLRERLEPRSLPFTVACCLTPDAYLEAISKVLKNAFMPTLCCSLVRPGSRPGLWRIPIDFVISANLMSRQSFL
jgi:hypothetical protein